MQKRDAKIFTSNAIVNIDTDCFSTEPISKHSLYLPFSPLAVVGEKGGKACFFKMPSVASAEFLLRNKITSRGKCDSGSARRGQFFSRGREARETTL